MAELWLIAALTASAPEAAHPAVGEIVVTGERVPRSVQETRSSVAVFTDRDIEALAAPDRLEQLLALTPNVQLGSGGEGPAIRGQDTTGPLRDLPAFLSGTRPRTTIEVDGRAISYNELAFGVTSLWDVAQVEIFRTPQTTTQGRNAIAGAIFVRTAEPSFSWSARGRVLAGDARTRQASATLTGPIVDGEAAFRAAADIRRSRTSSLITSPARVDPNRDAATSLRAKLLLTPSALPGSRLELIGSRIEADMPQIEGVQAPFRTRRDPLATYGIFRTRVSSAAALLTQELNSRLELRGTFTHGSAEIRRFAPRGFGETRNYGSDWAGEASLDWKPRDTVRLILGARSDRTSLDQAIDLSATPLGAGTFADRQRSVGSFGELNWNPLPAVTFIAGLRYQRDDQSRSGGLVGSLGPIQLRFRGRFDAWLPKVSLNYEFAPGVEAGFLVQRAYNPGGTTLDLASGAPRNFESESLWDKELVFRASLFDRRLRLSANLFDQAIRDAQRPLARLLPTPRGPVTYAEIINAPRAWSRGMEAEASWIPTSALALRGSLGLLRTRLHLPPASPFVTGRRFQRSPSLSAAASLEWRPERGLYLSGQIRHNSSYFSDDAETAALRVGGSTTVDARTALTRGPVTFFGYVRNLFDEFHLTWRFPAVAGRELATAGDPREAGIGLDLKF